MQITLVASEYLESATLIKNRMDELKTMQKTKNFKDQKKLEDRIIILCAEYYHLLHIASYLGSYYVKAPKVSIMGVQYN